MTHSLTRKITEIALCILFGGTSFTMAGEGHSGAERKSQAYKFNAQKGHRGGEKWQGAKPNKTRTRSTAKGIKELSQTPQGQKIDAQKIEAQKIETQKRKEFDEARKKYLQNSKNMTMAEREKATEELKRLGERWNPTPKK